MPLATCSTCGATKSVSEFYRHMTGAVRGLICDPCNRGLGAFRDRPDALLAASAYLLQQQDVLTRAGE